MQALSGTSQRRSAAAKFAHALRAAKARKGVGNRVICEAAGIPRSNLGYYLTGRNLPTVQVAKLLADVLDEPLLAQIALRARTVACGRPGCSRSFVYEGGKPKVYCSEDCRALATKLRAGDDEFDTGGKRLYALVAGELEDARASGRSVRRAALDVGLVAYARADAKRHARFATYQRRIDGLQGSIDEMCRSCEPEGLCQTPDCPLRAFSPLPIEGTFSAQRRAGEVRRPEGTWGPTNRGRMLEVVRAANERRWAKPGEREAAREAMASRGSAMRERSAAAIAQRPRESFSEASKRAWETRRARAAAPEEERTA
ncbi:MAG: helix-turn-helix transcriptional regulator [Chloroflexota bacterium]